MRKSAQRVATASADDAVRGHLRQRLRRSVAWVMAAVTTTGLLLVATASSGEASPAFQGDCGRLTCTVRLDRAQTRNARDAGAVIGLAAGGCGALSLGVLSPVCAAAVAPVAGVVAVAAARFYEQGDCLQIKVAKIAPAGGVPPALPGAVRRGTRNCT